MGYYGMGGGGGGAQDGAPPTPIHTHTHYTLLKLYIHTARTDTVSLDQVPENYFVATEHSLLFLYQLQFGIRNGK